MSFLIGCMGNSYNERIGRIGPLIEAQAWPLNLDEFLEVGLLYV